MISIVKMWQNLTRGLVDDVPDSIRDEEYRDTPTAQGLMDKTYRGELSEERVIIKPETDPQFEESQYYVAPKPKEEDKNNR